MSEVLVLNRNYYAIQITSWQRAIGLLYVEHAEVVDEEYRTYDFKDWLEISRMMGNGASSFVRTPSFRIAIPEVIALKFYDKLPSSEVKFTRKNIYEHYAHKCCYCGKKFPTSGLNLDHVIPRSRGGRTSWDNIVTSCVRCNIKKGSRFPAEAGMKLLVPPSKPRWSGALSLAIRANVKIKTSWQKFVDNVYWNIELDRD
ncbi:MAG: HNH endonuclease [Elusimicrobia bacterium HGW-Elusimicrobia-1]|jgi:5-methylcytosine-specific restriction endonuclease McrA|nr:MAG: HNH endonuclease [Elusimicrobia bacterium HGW-Elusimicrobia-1]